MSVTENVMEYKCPCCGAGLIFGNYTQKMVCQYCDNTFYLEDVKAYNDSLEQENGEQAQWDSEESIEWSEEDQESVQTYTCPSCGGVLMTDAQTAATFCPYCENPTIIPGRLSGGLKPHAVIPFKTSKEDAKNAFLQLCKGKLLLPKSFTSENRVEKITGMYVPFWLYDCGGDLNGRYNATRVHSWSDSHYHYTKTEHFLLLRSAAAEFASIPMDASTKMDNEIMESIEPYDYSEMVDFDTAYLSGYLADKYDVESELGHERVRQRIYNTIDEIIAPTLVGYATAIPAQKNVNVTHGSAKYVLLPVWMLHTKYKDKTYTFAMNGQTGKMTGKFPICPKRSAAWFAGVCAAVTALIAAIQLLAW